MNKLYTKNAAIQYLREQTGQMSRQVFAEEVRQGRIPEKPYGKSVRYRKEDLDRWQTITHMHRTDYSDETVSGMRTSRSLLLDDGLSFADLLAKQTNKKRKIGTSTR